MGNCTNKQDSPRNLSILDSDKQKNCPHFQISERKSRNSRDTSCSNKYSVSTCENSNRNSGSISSISIYEESSSVLRLKKQQSSQQPSNLEQIEELESSYFQSEIRQLDSGIGYFNNNTIYGNNQSQNSQFLDSNKITLQKQIALQEINNPNENYSVSQDSRETQISFTRQSLNVSQISQIRSNSNSRQIQHSRQSSNMSQSSQASYLNTSNNMQRSQGSNYSKSPRLREKHKSAQEIRNIIRMQTESYFSNFISIELNNILQKGEKMSTVMEHFQFSNYDQVLDLVRDIFKSIQNKKNKLTEIVLQEHREILKQFIQQAQLLIDRGIAQLLKTSSKQMNMNCSNPNQDTREVNLDLATKTLEVLVEAYQVIQYFQLQVTNKTNVSSNKWWTKNQNEKDLSSFYIKFVKLSQQLNAEFQDKQSLTPSKPKLSQNDKKHKIMDSQTININIPLKNSNSIEIQSLQSSDKTKSDEDSQSMSESSLSPFNKEQLSQNQFNFNQTVKEQ